MQIREVEKVTGLTQKSIRYYEEKGLLSVNRNKENDYRDYTEENIERLGCIKLLRYLGFSIQEMSCIFEDLDHNWTTNLEKKAKELQEENKLVECKKDLCDALIRDGYKKEVIDEYNSTIEFLESETYVDLKTSLLSIICNSISKVILMTIVLIVPIINMFVYIKQGKTDEMILVSLEAIVATVLITLNWTNYLINRKKYAKMQQEKNRSNRFLFLEFVGAVVGSISFFVILSIVQQKILAPDGWLFYNMRPWAELVLMVCVGMWVINLGYFIIKRGKQGSASDEEPVFYSIFQKYPIAISCVLLSMIMFCLFQTTFVTSDSIVDYSIKHPFGKTYSYGDIEQVDASFGTHTFSFLTYKRKGEFSYTIYFDGEKRVFSVPSVNEKIEKYNEDTYLELEEFDQQLMKLGIKKTSDETCWDKCNLDQQYVDRFRRIIRNK